MELSVFNGAYVLIRSVRDTNCFVHGKAFISKVAGNQL
jgi:hypothetical protein